MAKYDYLLDDDENDMPNISASKKYDYLLDDEEPLPAINKFKKYDYLLDDEESQPIDWVPPEEPEESEAPSWKFKNPLEEVKGLIKGVGNIPESYRRGKAIEESLFKARDITSNDDYLKYKNFQNQLSGDNETKSAFQSAVEGGAELIPMAWSQVARAFKGAVTGSTEAVELAKKQAEEQMNLPAHLWGAVSRQGAGVQATMPPSKTAAKVAGAITGFGKEYYMYAYNLGHGDIKGQILDSVYNKRGTLTEENIQRADKIARTIAVPYAALDVGGDIFLGKVFTGAIKNAVKKKFLKAALKYTAEVGVETLSEGGQAFLSRISEDVNTAIEEDESIPSAIKKGFKPAFDAMLKEMYDVLPSMAGFVGLAKGAGKVTGKVLGRTESTQDTSFIKEPPTEALQAIQDIPLPDTGELIEQPTDASLSNVEDAIGIEQSTEQLPILEQNVSRETIEQPIAEQPLPPQPAPEMGGQVEAQKQPVSSDEYLPVQRYLRQESPKQFFKAMPKQDYAKWQKAEAELEAMKETDIFRKVAIDYVKEYLPTEEQGKILKGLKKLKTEGQRVNLFNKIQSVREHYDRVITLKSINQLFKDAKPFLGMLSDTNVQNLQSIIDSYSTSSMRDSTRFNLIEEMKDLYEKYEVSEEIPYYLQQAKIINKRLNKTSIKDLSLDEMVKLKNDVEEVLRQTVDSVSVILNGQRFPTQEVADAFSAEVSHRNYKAPSQVSTTKDRAPAEGGMIKGALSYATANPDVLVQMLRGTPDGRHMLEQHLNIREALNKAYGREFALKDMFKPIDDFMKANGDKKFNYVFRDENGKGITFTYSELVGFYNMIQNPNNFRAMKKTGLAFDIAGGGKTKFNEESFPAFKLAIESDPKFKQVLEQFRTIIDTQVWQNDNDAMLALKGKELPPPDPSNPYLSKVTQQGSYKQDPSVSEGIGKVSIEDVGYLKDIKGGGTPVLQTYESLRNNLLNRARLPDFIQQIKNWKSLRSNKTFRDAILETMDKKYLKELERWMMDVERYVLTGRKTEMSIPALSGAMNFAHASFLSIFSAPAVPMYQATSLFSAATMVPEKYIVQALQQFGIEVADLRKLTFGDVKEILKGNKFALDSQRRAMESSNIYRKRRESEMQLLMGGGAESDPAGAVGKAIKKANKIIEKTTLAPIKGVDLATVGSILFRAIENQALAEGLNADWIRQRFNDVMDITQPSNEITALPGFVRKYGTAGRIIWPFYTAIRAVDLTARMATQRLLNGEITKGQFAKAMLYTVAVGSSVYAIKAGYKKLTKDDDEMERMKTEKQMLKQTAKTLLDTLSVLPVGVRPEVNILIRALQAYYRGDDFFESLPIARALQVHVRAAGQVIEDLFMDEQFIKMGQKEKRSYADLLNFYTKGISGSFEKIMGKLQEDKPVDNKKAQEEALEAFLKTYTERTRNGGQ